MLQFIYLLILNIFKVDSYIHTAKSALRTIKFTTRLIESGSKNYSVVWRRNTSNILNVDDNFFI